MATVFFGLLHGLQMVIRMDITRFAKIWCLSRKWINRVSRSLWWREHLTNTSQGCNKKVSGVLRWNYTVLLATFKYLCMYVPLTQQPTNIAGFYSTPSVMPISRLTETKLHWNWTSTTWSSVIPVEIILTVLLPRTTSSQPPLPSYMTCHHPWILHKYIHYWMLAINPINDLQLGSK